MGVAPYQITKIKQEIWLMKRARQPPTCHRKVMVELVKQGAGLMNARLLYK